MIPPREKPVVKLVGEDGNGFAIVAKVATALKREGADVEYVNDYKKRAKSGDYDNLLQVTLDEIEVC